MNRLLATALTAALQAGKAIMEIYNSDDFGIEEKEDKSPLTKADKIAHEVITKYLKQHETPILSEEGKDIPFEDRKNWESLWIVDPIDGTKEFIKRNGEFTVNIALVKNNLPILGVIYVPALQTLYYAENNEAFKVEAVTIGNAAEKIKSARILKNNTTQDKNQDTATVVASKSHLTPETEAFIAQLKAEYKHVKTIAKGSSLKLCMVAEGVADFYPRFAPTMEWDTAAGQAICMAAGCDVIDQNTSETMIYNRENLLNNWFLVKK